MPAEVEFDPDVFHGELTANRGQVFVRAARTAEFAACYLSGYVQGPRCEYAHTLPAKYQLTDLGAGPTLLARATITDPCYWTSDLPQLYDVHIELRRGSELVAREKRLIGLRGIGPRGRELVREGKIWVPRGVTISDEPGMVDQLRDELLVGVCSNPSLDLLNEASRRGAYLIASLAADRPDFIAALRSLARWPAVMMAIVHGGEKLERSLQQVAPNLLLTQPAPQSENFRVAAWANALIVDEAGPFPAVSLPILVQRTIVAPVSLDSARSACDQLQRDGAPRAQFAGYLLTKNVSGSIS